MPKEIENLLQSFRPAGPPAGLREKILTASVPASRAPSLRWPLYLFRSAIAATLVLSFTLIHAANTLNQNSATQVGIGPARWTPEAQQAADLIDPNGTAGRRYIALCLLADNARTSHNAQNTAPGDFR